MPIRYLSEEFDRLMKQISSSFVTLVRLNDGELALMEGRPLGTNTVVSHTDRWTAPEGLTALGKDLRELGKYHQWWQGTACDCCLPFQDGLRARLKGYPIDNLTLSNMFVNGNHARAMKFFSSLSQPVILFSNFRTEHVDYPFPIKERALLPEDCVNVWESHRDDMIRWASRIAIKHQNSLFLFAGGPMNVLIRYMYDVNPYNHYLDIGSSLDHISFPDRKRDFLFPQSPYHTRNCVLTLPDRERL